MNEFNRCIKIIKEKNKIIISIILAIIAFAFIAKLDLYMFLGEGKLLSYNLLELSYSILVKYLFLYINIELFRYDISKNKNQIFQRISKEKWYINKIVNIVIINLFVYLSMIVGYLLLSKSMIKIDINFLVNIFLANVIFSFIGIVLHIIKKEKHVAVVSATIISLLGIIPVLRKTYLEMLSVNFSIWIILFMLLIYVISKVFVKFIEKEE